MQSPTKKLVTLAMLAALSYLTILFIRIYFMPPPVAFLTYDPKDVIIIIGGFLFGPGSAVMVALVVALAEMITVAETGMFGALMNFLTSATFAGSASFIYHRFRNLGGAVAGLIAGVLLTTGVALLWNYLVVPIYTGFPREVVAGMLVPYFLPFNLIKGGLNAAIVMLLYKPVSTALRASGLIAEKVNETERQGFKPYVGAMVVAGFVLVSLVLVILAYQGRV